MKIFIYKKGFTLIEVLISIALFFTIVLFLYQALDMSQKSNLFYEEKVSLLQNKDSLRLLLYQDVLDNSEKNSTKVLSEDKNNNTIFKLNSSNTFHNYFYPHITYFLGKENELIRIESKKYFDERELNEILEESYVDVVFQKVSKFRVVQNEKDKAKFAIFIEFEDGEKLYLTAKSQK
jgi:prepilin-type N-terminal cleavage/methylation domain-containing protein